MTSNDMLALIQDPSNWRQTRKLDYCVWARKAPHGIVIRNSLEDQRYFTKKDFDIVIAGTYKEQWVITEKRLKSTYQNMDGSPITELTGEGVYETNGWTQLKTIPNGRIYFAIHIPIEVRDLEVEANYGTFIVNSTESDGHGDGDYILTDTTEDMKPAMGDIWCVNNSVFVRTYDQTNFGNAVQPAVNHEAPKWFNTILYTGG